MKGKAQWSLLDEIPLEKISISLFLFLLACFIFFTDMLCGTPESLFIISYFLFLLLCGIHLFFYLLSSVEAVPIFLVLFLTPSCDKQYLPLNLFFHLLSFSYFPHLSFLFTSSLPLINSWSSRHSVTLLKIYFSPLLPPASTPNLFFSIHPNFYPWF